VRADTKLVRNASLVRQVRLEDVVRVSYDTVKEIIVGVVERVGDGRNVVAAVPEPFSASQQRTKTRRLQIHCRPCRNL